MALTLLSNNRPGSILTELEKRVSLSKAVIYEAIVEAVEELEPEVTKTPSLDKIKPSQQRGHRHARNECLRPSRTDRFRRYARIASSRAQAFVNNNKEAHSTHHEHGKSTQDHVDPSITWSDRKERILLNQCTSTVIVQGSDGSLTTMINAASSNYGGFYEVAAHSENLQRNALERLPVANAGAVPALTQATDETLARFFASDFSICCASGHRSNHVVLRAITNSKTLVLLDEACNSSLLNGAYLSQPGCIVRYGHNDSERLEELLRQNIRKFQRIVVVVEGLYSAYGDTPPLNDIRRLKEVYKFVLVCDETHSYCSIGSSGGGCLQYWNEEHPENLVPEDLIDIRTGSFAKAVGGAGGFVCGKGDYQRPISSAMSQLERACSESLSSSQVIQTLWIHGQRTMVERHLRRLAEISRFCRAELKRFDIHVHGDDGIPILPIHAERSALAVRLSNVLSGKGVLANPTFAPVVPHLSSRVVVNLSASHSDAEINKILDAIVSGCKEVGLCKKSGIVRRKYHALPRHAAHYLEELEASKTFEQVFNLINRAVLHHRGKEELVSASRIFEQDRSIVQRGHNSRTAHGLGSGGSRWAFTFPPHLAVECLVARRTATEACMTYPDSYVGLASIVAALSRQSSGHAKHYTLVPRYAPQAIGDGLTISSAQSSIDSCTYDDQADLIKLVRDRSRNRKAYFTIHIQLPQKPPPACISAILCTLLKHKASSAGMTVLVHSPDSIPQAAELQIFTKLAGVQVLVCGSFHRMFGLPGGFVVGSEAIVNELRCASSAYMSSTSCQPFIMEMVRANLEKIFRISGPR